MTAEPGVTVVIPTHNRRDLLMRTLDSVLRQEGVGLQVVVVDDGGSDGTIEAVRSLGVDAVRTIRHDHSRGVSAARNAGLSTVMTPWVAFVDDDDIWAPDKLRRQVSAILQSGGARWSCVGAVHVDAAVEVLDLVACPGPEDVAVGLLSNQVIPGGGSGALVDTHLALEIGGFDENISILADWDFYLRLSIRAPVASVNEPLVGYFVHQDSMFHDPVGCAQELLYLERKSQALPDGERLRFNRAWFPQLARMAYRLGDKHTSRKLLWMGLREAGPAPVLGLVLRRVLKRLERLRNGPPAAPFADAQLVWLDRYRRWEETERTLAAG